MQKQSNQKKLSEELKDMFTKDGHFAGDNDELIEFFVNGKKFKDIVEETRLLERQCELHKKRSRHLITCFNNENNEQGKAIDDAAFLHASIDDLFSAAEMFSVTLDEMSMSGYSMTKSQEDASNRLWKFVRHFKPMENGDVKKNDG